MNPRISIGGRAIGRGEPLFLIAEAGVNHENDLDVAKEMIRQAAAAGADAIKFQSYKAGALASRNSPAYWDRTKEPASSQFALFQRFDHLEVGDYLALKEHCDQHGIVFLTTVFDERFLAALGPAMPALKVASADITHYPLLKQIAATNKPVFLSVGASTLGEIAAAVNLLRAHGTSEIALLHCVLEYPCPPANANLRAIEGLQRIFPELVIGYSDHVPPSHDMLHLNAAWMLGATVVEKHFTLNKDLPGNDHYHAMDPDDIRRFRERQAHLEALMGDGRVGDPAPDDTARLYARRSLVARCPIPKGTAIHQDMIAVKRPGTGIAPDQLDTILGAKAVVDIEEDAVLEWKMLLDM